MKQLNLLIVEDKSEQITLWEKAVKQFNRLARKSKKDFTFHAEYAKSYQEANNKIHTFRFDTAVVDIRLDGDSASNHKNTEGNEVLREIIDNSISLVVVYTAQKVDVDITEEEQTFIRTVDKSQMTKRDLLDWFISQEVLLKATMDMKKTFNQSMAKLFYRSIWPRWDMWISDTSSPSQDALCRHMATHLHASLLNDGNQRVHPEEYFFIPPLQEQLDTGDILYSGSSFEIVITPRCDMQRVKSKKPTFQLIRLEDMSTEWLKLEAALIKAKADGNIKKTNSANSALVKFTNHNGLTGSHFVQKFRINLNGEVQEFGPFYAQFDDLRSAPRTEQTIERFEKIRVASLSNEFVPSLVERLGAYFSRIGTPDYSHPE